MKLWRRMLRILIVFNIVVYGAIALYANGNLLIWPSGPAVQVCIGWPDDTMYSWWCTPDLTVPTIPIYDGGQA